MIAKSPTKALLLLSLLSTLIISKIVMDADVVETDTLKVNTFLPDTLSSPDSTIVDQFNMTFNSYYLHTTPVLSSTKEYTMIISGTYRIAGSNNGLDAAFYYCYVGCSGGCSYSSPCSTVLTDTRITHSLRPDNDVFQTNHAYYYSFMGADTAMVFEFTDTDYGDNAGSLNVALYDTSDDQRYIQIDSSSLLLKKAGSGFIMKSPNGACWRIRVNNSGSLVTSATACPG